MAPGVQTYLLVALIVAGSLLIGGALCPVGPERRRAWAAPAVGLAAGLILAGAAIKLPGRDATAAAVLLVAVALSCLWLWRRRSWPPVDRVALIAGAVALLGASIPYVASGRVGLPGVSLDNDTANHLLWADMLRSPHMAALYGGLPVYPLGPHSLVAALGAGTGISLDLVFTALLIAIVPITAIVASGFLERETWWRRVAVGALASLFYLVAAYYGEGAFKETIVAALLLAFVLHLEGIRGRWAERRLTAPQRVHELLPAAVLLAGAIYTYSYPALAFFGGAVVVWAVVELVPTLMLGGRWRRAARLLVPSLAGAGVITLVLVLPVIGNIVSFFHSTGLSPSGSGAVPASNLGNLAGPLSPFEGLGIWATGNFLFPPASAFHAGEWGALALGVLLLGAVWSVRARRLLLPAAVGACALIWWRSSHTQSPYVTAKALVIAGPLVAVLGLRGLLDRRVLRDRRQFVPDAWLSAARLTLALVFIGAAGWSSWQVLRNEPVRAPEGPRELNAFRARIGEGSVLFLGNDDYASWDLRGTAMSALAPSTVSLSQGEVNPHKQFTYGQEFDFDSIAPETIDRFDYVITTNTPDASQAPANFRLVERRRLYELWLRTGPTMPRQFIDVADSPGAVLDCRTASGRRLSRRAGVAAVMTPPLAVPLPSLLPGTNGTVGIALPRGRWDLSVRYMSDVPVDIAAQGRSWTMPAYLGRPGPLFLVGTVSGAGTRTPVPVRLAAHRPSRITGDDLVAQMSVLVATAHPDVRRMVPLSRACGRYIDWYRLSS